MIFKCGPIELIYSFRTILAELVQLEIANKYIIQIIANDFNGFTNLCFRKVCNLMFVIFLSFSSSLVRSYGLVYTKTDPIGFIMTFE